MKLRLHLTALCLALTACGSSVDSGVGGSGVTTSTSSSTLPTQVCADGATQYTPGCDEDPAKLLPAGCYMPCSTPGAACPTGGTCRTVVYDPCPCGPSDTVCCGACGAQTTLCAP